MKLCPTCHASYPDEANFCGADGAQLVSETTTASASVAPETTPSAVPLAERLERLGELRQMGLLTDFEYAFEKQKLIAEG